MQILENVAIDSDLAKGRRYFEGSVKFMRTLQEVLDMLIDSVSFINIMIDLDIYHILNALQNFKDTHSFTKKKASYSSAGQTKIMTVISMTSAVKKSATQYPSFSSDIKRECRSY